MFNGTLMIPMMLRGVIPSIQFIKADGTKNFKGGARSSGAYCKIGFENNQTDLIVICEGYATAASIHEATHAPLWKCIINILPLSNKIER